MTVAEYFSDQCLNIVGIIGVCAFLIFTGTSKDIVIILLIIWGVVSIILSGINYYKKNEYIKAVSSVLEGLDKKYLLMECVTKPRKNYDKKIFSLMQRMGKAMIEEVSDMAAEQKEYKEYIENWVHEVKVPITTIELISNNNKSEVTNKIIFQVKEIEEQVERALYYARVRDMEQDLVVQKVVLKYVINETIQKYKQLLIQNNVSIEVENAKQMVYTDAKGLGFILGQLLSNAVRYKSENAKIKIKAKSVDEQVHLEILDNGIGIPAQDIPRVFAKGFTGANGRVRASATGMGLYVSEKMADHLQIDLSIESVVGEYTKINLLIPAKKLTKV